MDARQHQGVQRVVDLRIVEVREQLLADSTGHQVYYCSAIRRKNHFLRQEGRTVTDIR